VAEALSAIHGAGLVHRDLKPSNVLLAADGPRVIDFGIARAAEATELTRTGVRVGTPQYMAPEQVRGAAVGTAADVWALGALAAFAATGRPPFGEGSEAAVLYRVLHEQPDLAGCPGEVARVIRPCLTAQAP
jgi:serine/threonine protein kinase